MLSISPDVQRRVSYWLNGPFDEKTKTEVRLLQQTPQALIDAFLCDLSFGTGGLRGLMGAGTNRLNIYTIRLATQGLANYLKKQEGPKKLSVVIGFDSRHHSQEFANEAAKVLAGNGICVYLISELRPTPYISFACRFKKASAAIMITASHNPKEYNGYKVYWSDGAQVVFPHDEGIVKEVESLGSLAAVKLKEFSDPLIEQIAVEPLDQEYLKAIAPLQHFKEESHREGASLQIVYTSLHGTGITLIPKALKEWGFSTLHLVENQVTIDGDFPTVQFPNPEYPQTLKLGIEKMQSTGAEILLASDPDADRLGVVVKHQGIPTLINGNEMAALCVDYLGTVLRLSDKSAFVTTIVTTELLKKIAHSYKATLIEVLTGFKYIGEKIHLWEMQPDGYQFIFGAEESYGYLLGTQTRDKDAIVASCLIAEMTLHAKLQGLTLIDCLHQIYRKHGIYREKQDSLNFKPGQEGMEQMAAVMKELRSKPPKEIGGHKVIYIEDYEIRKRIYVADRQEEPLDLPVSDVLLFRLSEGSRLIIRPSGTEPKVKIYGSVCTETFETIDSGIQTCEDKLKLLIQALKKETGCTN